MDIDEKSYSQGSRMACRSMLQTCCSELGYGDTEAAKATWILEREAAISELREICAERGDNEWSDKHSLNYIIERYLRRNLGQNNPTNKDT